MMLINGELRRELCAEDRGLHFGDGVFETIALEDGRALCLDRHLRRLGEGCQRLGIAAPGVSTLEQECARVYHGVERGVMKLVVTRGVSERGYAPARDASPTRIVARYPWPRYPAALRNDGVAVRVCTTRLGRNPRLAGIKHLNRLEQVLARSEDAPAGCAEGLMLDDRGHVIEGITSNLFVRRDRRLSTPDLCECGVAGIMRELVLEAAAEVDGLEAEIACIGIEDLASADECFLTNSLIGVWPINSLEGKALAVGPVAHALQELLVERGAMTRD
jgi:4-amino-4-deoxychorismate lyase